jgi:hypothetical protein
MTNHNPGLIVFLTLLVTVLVFVACSSLPEDSGSSDTVFFLPMEPQALNATPQPVCESCALATAYAWQTQQQYSLDAQAAATAEIMRAHAQATLNAVNATLSSAMTQEKNDANVIAAQVEATAAIIRANAQATLYAAASTQYSAMTQDAIYQTQMVALATQNAIATLNQQNSDALAAGTQTAVAEYIATQTRSGVATEQWYTEQVNQRNDQWQSYASTVVWFLCLPLLVLSTLFLVLVFFWRWMKIKENQQRLEIQPNKVVIIEHEARSDLIAPTAPPQDNMGRWLDEVTRKLLAGKKEDDNGKPDN